jgi:hypothetical protein
MVKPRFAGPGSVFSREHVRFTAEDERGEGARNLGRVPVFSPKPIHALRCGFVLLRPCNVCMFLRPTKCFIVQKKPETCPRVCTTTAMD